MTRRAPRSAGASQVRASSAYASAAAVVTALPQQALVVVVGVDDDPARPELACERDPERREVGPQHDDHVRGGPATSVDQRARRWGGAEPGARGSALDPRASSAGGPDRRAASTTSVRRAGAVRPRRPGGRGRSALTSRRPDPRPARSPRRPGPRPPAPRAAAPARIASPLPVGRGRQRDDEHRADCHLLVTHPVATITGPCRPDSLRSRSTIVAHAQIPRTAHFVFGLRPQVEPFHLVHYLAIASCAEVVAPAAHRRALPRAARTGSTGTSPARSWSCSASPPVAVGHRVPLRRPRRASLLVRPPGRRRAPRRARRARWRLRRHRHPVRRATARRRYGTSPWCIGREADVFDPRVGASRPSVSNALVMAEPGARFVDALARRDRGRARRLVERAQLLPRRRPGASPRPTRCGSSRNGRSTRSPRPPTGCAGLLVERETDLDRHRVDPSRRPPLVGGEPARLQRGARAADRRGVDPRRRLARTQLAAKRFLPEHGWF